MRKRQVAERKHDPAFQGPRAIPDRHRENPAMPAEDPRERDRAGRLLPRTSPAEVVCKQQRSFPLEACFKIFQ